MDSWLLVVAAAVTVDVWLLFVTVVMTADL